MEFLNRIEIRGIIGSVSVKQIGNAKSANISVVTEYFHTAKDGCAVIETTWHRVDAWEGDLVRNLDQLKKGSCHIVLYPLPNPSANLQLHQVQRLPLEGCVDIQ